jgi:hypothetical protein
MQLAFLLAEKYSELPHERERQLSGPSHGNVNCFTELKRFCGLLSGKLT